MTTVGLVCSEPLRARMGGLGVRFFELARLLGQEGLRVVLVHPGSPGQLPGDLAVHREQRYVPGGLESALAGCDAVFAQGSLADAVVEEELALPLAVDLIDPWLVENLSYAGVLGDSAYRRDLASWKRQLRRGDFFVCASEEQRLYYLGLLTALGRVRPEDYGKDPELRGLIDLAPSGIPESLPEHRPYLPPSEAPRVLFGRLYDWFDPWPALAALERLPAVQLLFFRTPNASSTPQTQLARVEHRARERGWLGTRVQILDPYPADRRFDVLRDVQALLATHRPSLETALSFRTRLLDAIAVGCPPVVSAGGALSARLAAAGLGHVVPPGDGEALARALGAALATPPASQRFAPLAEELGFARCVAPLLAFLRAPRRRPAAAGTWGERLERRLRRALGALGSWR